MPCPSSWSEEASLGPFSTILPTLWIAEVVMWGIDDEIRWVLEGVVIPETCPMNCLYVPPTLCSRVIQWGHSSSLSCNPGVASSVGLLRQLFRSLTLKDVLQVFFFIAACPVCVQKKTSCQWPEMALSFACSTHHCSWTFSFRRRYRHSYNCRQFLQDGGFVPLIKLLFTKETGKAMLANFFLTACCSRPGPQFALCLWKEFHRPIEPSFEGSILSTVVMEWYNQVLETELCTMVSQSPFHWKRNLVWVEYTHNSLPVSVSASL